MYYIFYSSTQNLPEVILILINENVILGVNLVLIAFSVFVTLILCGHLTVFISLSIQLSGTTPSSSRVPSLQTALVYMTWKGKHMRVTISF